MQVLFKAREKHGDTFATIFPDGLEVPWKCLPIKEYIEYSFSIRRQLYTLDQIEDEIFKKCVTDSSLVRAMSYEDGGLKAGVVAVVVQNIWEYSGPKDATGISEDLGTARAIIQDPQTKIFHQLLKIISMGFPYKPEEIYAMDYETLLLRAAQAEDKLLMLGVMKDPIQIEIPRLEEVKPKIEPLDAKKLWEQQQVAINKTLPKVPPPVVEEAVSDKVAKAKEKRWWKESPVLETKPQHGINFTSERKSQDSWSSGHEKQDEHLERTKMIEDAQKIYKDVLSKLPKKK